MLHAASPAFDASILEYLLVLGSGATLVVVPDGVYGPDEIADIVRTKRVTHWFSTPAVPAQIDPDDLDDLRVLASAERRGRGTPPPDGRPDGRCC